jgi:immunoglobulin-binding protein 1
MCRENVGPPKRYKALLEEGLEDDEELLDIAAVKDREWDAWKDDNPRGAGVTKRF